MSFSPKDIATLIDHTNLKANSTEADIKRLCQEAMEHRFYSVCVNPCYVKFCQSFFDRQVARRGGSQSRPLVITAIGFPLGASTTATKVFETKDAIQNGAQEIDMVLNVSAVKSDQQDSVLKDIQSVVEAAGDIPVKVILETCYLTDKEKILACVLSKSAGAAFVKTSTGFGTGGATADDIKLMRKTVGPEMGVKASGGIRDLKTVIEMIVAGANRLGLSESVNIIS